jgi:hypothetical protein
VCGDPGRLVAGGDEEAKRRQLHLDDPRPVAVCLPPEETAMTPSILAQATQLRNVARQLAIWLTPDTSSEGKQMADIVCQRAETLLAEIRAVSPQEEPDRFSTT